MTIAFDWDPDKNLSNQKKHGVSFETAAHVFADPLRKSIIEGVVDGEERWETVGRVEDTVVLLLVVHLWEVEEDEDEDSDTEYVRIISARVATAHERQAYEEDA